MVTSSSGYMPPHRSSNVHQRVTSMCTSGRRKSFILADRFAYLFPKARKSRASGPLRPCWCSAGNSRVHMRRRSLPIFLRPFLGRAHEVETKQQPRHKDALNPRLAGELAGLMVKLASLAPKHPPTTTTEPVPNNVIALAMCARDTHLRAFLVCLS